MKRITRVSKSTEVIPKSAEVAQPGRALDSVPLLHLRAKLKTGLSPVQTRPSAPQDKRTRARSNSAFAACLRNRSAAACRELAQSRHKKV